MLKYCMRNEFVSKQFQNDPLNMFYDKDKNPKCYEYIENEKELVNKFNTLGEIN